MNDAKLEKQFITLSRYAGGRFDLVQAAGGNASVKLSDGRMLIKASGLLLSEIEAGHGYVGVRTADICRITDASDHWRRDDRRARDAEITELVKKATDGPGLRASIEVFLHAELDRFVLHTHAIAVTAIAAGDMWKEDFKGIQPDALCVPYYTPGIDLGVELASAVRAYRTTHGRAPSVIFLQNHGLIVAADSAADVRACTEAVAGKCAAMLGIDYDRYAMATAVAEYVGGNTIAYLSEDRVLMDLLASNVAAFAQRPFLPDSLVFCGVFPLFVDDLSDTAPLCAYTDTHKDAPKVVVHEGRLYFIGRSMRKAREVEDVFKATMLARSAIRGTPRLLPSEELAHLRNWEAEKYRQKQ